MARPKNAVPTKPLTVHLPVDVLTKLQLHLFSDVDGRVPHGAYSVLFAALAKTHLEALDNVKEDALVKELRAAEANNYTGYTSR